MRFNYRRYVTDNGIAHRPVVALTIIGPKGVVCWDTLVDTGSDITLFPAVIAEDIGIDLAGAEESAVRGIGEHSVETRDARVELELSDGVEVYRWQAEVSFLTSDGAESHLAPLGHGGGLNFFSASFDADTQTMEIIPANVFRGTISRVR